MGGREAQNKAPGGLIRNKKKYLKRERVKNRYEERTLQRKFYRQLIFKWDETDLLEIFNLPKLIKKKKIPGQTNSYGRIFFKLLQNNPF